MGQGNSAENPNSPNNNKGGGGFGGFLSSLFSSAGSSEKLSKEEIAKLSARRANIAAEILATEETYFDPKDMK